jgi:hypothetical protein
MKKYFAYFTKIITFLYILVNMVCITAGVFFILANLLNFNWFTFVSAQIFISFHIFINLFSTFFLQNRIKTPRGYIGLLILTYIISNLFSPPNMN